MVSKKTDIYVYAHWKGMSSPILIGTLSAHQAKGKKVFSFEYNKEWLKSKQQFLLDPEIGWYSGPQFSSQGGNFGIFMDSMPDTWGRTLMKRRRFYTQEKNNRPMNEVDFLLGVYDNTRMGALRFKLNPEGNFLDDNDEYPTPPWSSIRELQHAAKIIESDSKNSDTLKWLEILYAPGSSLGGARPKANILDENGNLWIAKFPSKNDTIDKAKWEYLAYKLAIKAGITMADSKIEKIKGKHYTFFTKRFDRDHKDRIHFASAMTMTQNNEILIRDNNPSYLEIAEFIQFNGEDVTNNLHQLWRRIVFNIAISNTDDHLRNHGFLLSNKGWVLSPAYDINPSIDKKGLSLNIDSNFNALDIELAKSVGEYFQLSEKQMKEIIAEVKNAVKQWRRIAKNIKISPSEQELMSGAFRF